MEKIYEEDGLSHENRESELAKEEEIIAITIHPRGFDSSPFN